MKLAGLCVRKSRVASPFLWPVSGWLSGFFIWFFVPWWFLVFSGQRTSDAAQGLRPNISVDTFPLYLSCAIFNNKKSETQSKSAQKQSTITNISPAAFSCPQKPQPIRAQVTRHFDQWQRRGKAGTRLIGRAAAVENVAWRRTAPMSGLGPSPGPLGLESRLYRPSQIPNTQKRICNLHSVFLPYGVRLSVPPPCIGRRSMQARTRGISGYILMPLRCCAHIVLRVQMDF